MNITKTITSLTWAAACLLASAAAVHAQASANTPPQRLLGTDPLAASGMQAGATSPWTDLGGGTAGITGQPVLTGTGPLVGGTETTLRVVHAPPDARMLIWVSYDPLPFSALGGTVHAFPFTLQLSVVADSKGEYVTKLSWPAVAPKRLWIQAIVRDVSVPQRLTLSNGSTAETKPPVFQTGLGHAALPVGPSASPTCDPVRQGSNPLPPPSRPLITPPRTACAQELPPPALWSPAHDALLLVPALLRTATAARAPDGLPAGQPASRGTRGSARSLSVLVPLASSVMRLQCPMPNELRRMYSTLEPAVLAMWTKPITFEIL